MDRQAGAAPAEPFERGAEGKNFGLPSSKPEKCNPLIIAGLQVSDYLRNPEISSRTGLRETLNPGTKIYNCATFSTILHLSIIAKFEFVSKTIFTAKQQVIHTLIVKAYPVLIIAWLIFLFCPAARAGADSLPSNLLILEATFQPGKLIKIFHEFPENGISQVSEINFNFQTRGKKYWQQHFRYPRVGISILHSSFGNPLVLGHSFALMPNFTLIKRQNERLRFEMRFGAGFAWFNRPFDAIENPENTVIGSSFTNVSQFSIGAAYRLSERLSASVGLSTWHFSNGHYRVPNVGANLVNASFGLQYFTKAPSGERFRHEKAGTANKLIPGIRMGLGMHETEGITRPYGGPVYPVYNASAFVAKRLHTISNFNAGLHFNYYTAWHQFIFNQHLFDSNHNWNASNVVLFAGHEFLVGKFSLLTELGLNVFAPYRHRLSELKLTKSNLINIYNANKIGCRFYFRDTRHSLSKNAFIELSIKTVGGKADFAETGLGYLF